MSIDVLATGMFRQAAPVKPAAAAPSAPSPSAGPADPAVAAGESAAADAPVTVETLRAAVEQIESFLKGSARSLEFTVDEATGRTVISVRDVASGELIRQIPSEDALRLARSLSNGSKSLIEIVAR